MPFINYYEILEIEQTSDMDVIRKAFNKLAKKYHPDRNIGDASAEMMMRKLNDAIAVLSDLSLRKNHDKKLTEENAKRLNKNAAVAAYNDGIASALRKDFQATIKHFTRAIELDPTFANAYISRGNAYSELKAYQKSVFDYTLAIKFDPENAGAYNSRGIAYCHLQKHPEAITDYTIAIEINPSEADIFYNRGLSYDALGKHDFALDDYIQAIRLNPLHAKAHIYFKKARQQLIGRDNTEGDKKPKKGSKKTAIYKNKLNINNTPLFCISSGVLILFVIIGLNVSLFKSIESSIEKEMVLIIPAGKFMMGSPASEKWHQNNETQHEVTLTKPYYIGKYEVTQDQWEAVMGSNPSFIKGTKLPVTDVSWEDCQEFIKKLNAKTNGGYRLPTEAEWEYACRAGTTTAFSFGNNITPKDANYDDYGIRVVGNYKPNAFGLYDMHGNVFELCEDWHGVYPDGIAPAPIKAANKKYCVLRGGCFFSTDGGVSSSFRWTNTSIVIEDRPGTIGLRLARTP